MILGQTKIFLWSVVFEPIMRRTLSIVGNKDWDSGANKGFVFSFRFASGPEWKVNIGDGNNRADINTGGAIADGEWHTLTATFDRSAWLKIYEDGVLLDSTDISSIGDINTDFGLRFGADGFKTGSKRYRIEFKNLRPHYYLSKLTSPNNFWVVPSTKSISTCHM